MRWVRWPRPSRVRRAWSPTANWTISKLRSRLTISGFDLGCACGLRRGAPAGRLDIRLATESARARCNRATQRPVGLGWQFDLDTRGARRRRWPSTCRPRHTWRFGCFRPGDQFAGRRRWRQQHGRRAAPPCLSLAARARDAGPGCTSRIDVQRRSWHQQSGPGGGLTSVHVAGKHWHASPDRSRRRRACHQRRGGGGWR